MAKKPKIKAEESDERLNRVAIHEWETLRTMPPPPAFSSARGVAAFRSWVAAAATINAQAVASVPLRLYVKKRAGRKCLFSTKKVSRTRMAWLRGDAKKHPSAHVIRKAQAMGDVEEATDDHPLMLLLNHVNPLFNGFDFASWRILSQELTGNAYTLMVKPSDSDPPTELWPLLPQFTTIVPSRDGWIGGYHYSRNGVDGVTFAREDVIHFKQVSLSSYIYGMGKVEKAWGVVNLNEANHVMDQALAENHARPDYAVIMEGATDEAAVRMQQQLDNRLKGRAKAGKSLVMGGKVTLMPLNFPPKDLQGRDDVVEEIAAVFGVPVTMLKANDPNLASSKTGYGQWRESTILPLCRLDEQALNQQLVPLYSEDLMLAYDNPVPDDEAAELAERSAYVNLGLVTRNEARVEDGYEPIDDPMADKLLVNGQPLGGYAPMAAAGPVVNVNTPAANAPDAAAKPVEAAPDVPVAQEIQTTEATVLNGAQISAAKDIVMAVVAGELPRDAGIGMLQAFFNLTLEKAESIMGSAGKAGVPTTPNPIPTQEASNGNGSSDSGDGRDGDGAADDSGDGDVGEVVGGAGAGGEVAEPGTGEGKSAGQGEARSAPEPNVDDGNTPQVISQKAVMNGQQSMHNAGCCPHHKGEADDTVRDEEREAPIKSFAVKMADIFARQREAVAASLAAGKAFTKEIGDDIAKLLAEFNDEIAGIVRPYVGATTDAGGKAGQAKLTAAGKPPGPDSYDPFDVTNPRVSEYLDSYTVRLRNEIQEYSGEAISQYVARSLEGGKSTAEIAAGLRDEASAAGGSMSPNRAEMIARTESARGYVEGQRMQWQESGVVEGKRWALAADACPFCEAMAAQFNAKSVALDQPFMAKGSTLTAADGGTMVLDYSDVQGPPLHPNDRCDLEPVLK